MFVVVSIFVAYGAPSGDLSTTLDVIVMVISLVVVYLAAKKLAPESYGVALQYGLIFAVVGIILDYLVSQKFAPGMFSSVIYWVNYALVVLVPLFAVKKLSVDSPQA